MDMQQSLVSHRLPCTNRYSFHMVLNSYEDRKLSHTDGSAAFVGREKPMKLSLLTCLSELEE